MRPLVRLIPLAAAAVGALAAGAAPPAAPAFHLKLVRSDPAENAVLAAPPAVVRLWFSQRAEVAVTRLRLSGPKGAVALGALASGAAPADAEAPRMPLRPGRADDAVHAPVRGAMTPGAYTLEWRTMAADGHPVAGRFAFRVGAAAPAARGR